MTSIDNRQRPRKEKGPKKRKEEALRREDETLKSENRECKRL